jgi:hypothetical protein
MSRSPWTSSGESLSLDDELTFLLTVILLNSTKLRVDHAATRFQLPDTSQINTHNEFVPPIVIVQIQIPSEPPTSIFSSAEDGPGWAIVMYYRISEVSLSNNFYGRIYNCLSSGRL